MPYNIKLYKICQIFSGKCFLPELSSIFCLQWNGLLWWWSIIGINFSVTAIQLWKAEFFFYLRRKQWSVEKSERNVFGNSVFTVALSWRSTDNTPSFPSCHTNVLQELKVFTYRSTIKCGFIPYLRLCTLKFFFLTPRLLNKRKPDPLPAAHIDEQRGNMICQVSFQKTLVSCITFIPAVAL